MHISCSSLLPIFAAHPHYFLVAFSTLLPILPTIAHHFLHPCLFSQPLLTIFSIIVYHFLQSGSPFSPDLLTIFSTLFSILSTLANHFIHPCLPLSPPFLTIFSTLAHHFLHHCSPLLTIFSPLAQTFLHTCSSFSPHLLAIFLCHLSVDCAGYCVTILSRQPSSYLWSPHQVFLQILRFCAFLCSSLLHDILYNLQNKFWSSYLLVSTTEYLTSFCHIPITASSCHTYYMCFSFFMQLFVYFWRLFMTIQ